MLNVTEPGTIEDLVADAAGQGRTVTVRLIRDWTAAGLLDAPFKRPAGKGHGSRKALYPATQRELFAVLLHHRLGNGISSLARIPVCIWMYWGEEFVPLRQVRIALKTWVGDPRLSKRQARQTARELLGQLDHPDATATARRELVEVLTDLAYTAGLDVDRLQRAARQVFEPDYGKLRRALGHPAAPITAEAVIDLIEARLTAVKLLNNNAVTDADFRNARHAHLVGYADYAMQQPLLAASAPPTTPGAYEPATAERALHHCCGDLLTMIGLQNRYPEQAARVRAVPAPRVTLSAPH